jgi:hypothetical protein
MTSTMTTSNDSISKQLIRYFLCMILVISATPFIVLAAFFSVFVDIPHITIELGNKNLVENVRFNVKTTETIVIDDSDTESDTDSDTESDSGNDSGNDADDEDNEDETPVITKKISGRVGGFEEDNYPLTPVRSRSPHEAPNAPQKPKPVINLTLDTDTDIIAEIQKKLKIPIEEVDDDDEDDDEDDDDEDEDDEDEIKLALTNIREKLRASTEGNDGDIRSALSESSERAGTPSECPPSS